MTLSMSDSLLLFQETWNFACFTTIFVILLVVIYYYHRPLNFVDKNEFIEKTTNSLIEKGFPNGWIPICESSDLGENVIKKVQVCGQNVILLRSSANGKPYALDAYCPHLGADLSVGGKVVKNCESDCVRCPFHGWVFRASDGAVVEVPYSETKKGPVGVKVKTWECLERNDLIFIWYHSQGDKPDWLPTKIEQINNKEWEFIGRSEHHINCPVQEIGENSADTFHADYTHGKLFLYSENLEPPKISFLNLISFKYIFTWKPCEPPEGHIARSSICAKVYLADRYLLANNTAEPIDQIGPYILHIPQDFKIGPLNYKGALILALSPVNKNCSATKMVLRLYIKPIWFSKIVGKLLLTFAYYNTTRDVVIWNNKVYIKSPPFIKEEKQLSSFRRWFAQFYSKNQDQKIDMSKLSW